MQELQLPPDAGFVVDWQMADDGPVIDLSTAESEVILPDDPTVRAGLEIEQDPDNPRWITTVRGVGYRFEP
jgi:hypothetical protein